MNFGNFSTIENVMHHFLNVRLMLCFCFDYYFILHLKMFSKIINQIIKKKGLTVMILYDYELI